MFCRYLTGTSLVTGGRIRLLNAELVYRVEPEDTVLILLYRRLSVRKGLKNSFRDLLVFCALIADEVASIRFIKAKAIPWPEARGKVMERGMEPERLQTLYCQHIGTRQANGWLYFDLNDYRLAPENCRAFLKKTLTR